MTRQIRIVHHTGYAYAGTVVGSHNEVRMTPRASREQWVMNARIDIAPTPWVLSYTDYWGTRVTAFEIREITRQTIGPDFARDQRIHHCFELRHRS